MQHVGEGPSNLLVGREVCAVKVLHGVKLDDTIEILARVVHWYRDCVVKAVDPDVLYVCDLPFAESNPNAEIPFLRDKVHTGCEHAVRDGAEVVLSRLAGARFEIRNGGAGHNGIRGELALGPAQKASRGATLVSGDLHFRLLRPV